MPATGLHYEAGSIAAMGRSYADLSSTSMTLWSADNLQRPPGEGRRPFGTS
ncbi:hypothetical protein [Microbulbifer sp.]|uniref:hypothetical protein n=1 Tax=Microbulbifer sp. TaxID=1908541 RepID=UPI003F33C53A